jgi:WD40 repeat protein
VWDAATGLPLAPKPEHLGFIHTIMFSPDGSRLITASDDRTARLWDAATGRPLGPPIEHAAAVLWASFSPDGGRIVTASGDMAARVWDLPRPLDLDPRRIVSSVQSRTGLAWDDQGGIVIMDGPSWEATRRPETLGSREDE